MRGGPGDEARPSKRPALWPAATPRKGAARMTVRRLGRLRLQHLFARRPVARAELVRLESVEHAESLRRVAADVEAVDRDVLDHIVRIDDEGRAEGDAFI